jgi:hypothetical protein
VHLPTKNLPTDELRVLYAGHSAGMLLEKLTEEPSLFQNLGHYYSPIVDLRDIQVQRVLDQYESPDLPERSDLQIDDEAIINEFRALAKFYPEIPFDETPSEKHRYFFNNGFFTYGDAVILFCMLRHRVPNRIIEVGSGFSSALMLDVNDMFSNGKMEVTLIEPYPSERLNALLKRSDSTAANIIPQQAQDVDISVFQKL